MKELSIADLIALRDFIKETTITDIDRQILNGIDEELKSRINQLYESL